MSADKRRLGRGLESLISSAREKSLSVEIIQGAGHRIQAIPTTSVSTNPFQPRQDFDLEALNDLVESLREHGLMQPIVVRKKGGAFEIIAGERRWRASQELGWDSIDAVVVEADDKKMIEWALVENIQRQQLGALELANAFRRMNKEFGQTQEEIAKAVGMSRSSVTNTMRLLDLPAVVQERVSRGTLSAGAARALLAISDNDERMRLAAQAESGAMSVRQVEDLVRQQTRGKTKNPKGRVTTLAPEPHQADLERQLTQDLSTRVQIKGSLKRGRLVIDFHSTRELDRLVRRLQGLAPTLSGPDDDGDTDASLTV